MEEIYIDIEKLREDLKDYYGTAMMFNPIAMMELEQVTKASNEKLIEIAQKNKIDLNDYIVENKIYKRY